MTGSSRGSTRCLAVPMDLVAFETASEHVEGGNGKQQHMTHRRRPSFTALASKTGANNVVAARRQLATGRPSKEDLWKGSGAGSTVTGTKETVKNAPASAEGALGLTSSRGTVTARRTSVTPSSSSITAGLRSPPLPSRVALKAKRVTTGEVEGERPAKRQHLGQLDEGARTTASRSESRPKHAVGPRRSIAFSAVKEPSSNTTAFRSSSNGTARPVLSSSVSSNFLQPASLSSSTSLVSLSPSKFGLTVPKAFSFGSSSHSNSAVKGSQLSSSHVKPASALAPSPLAFDQHIPHAVPRSSTLHRSSKSTSSAFQNGAEDAHMQTSPIARSIADAVAQRSPHGNPWHSPSKAQQAYAQTLQEAPGSPSKRLGGRPASTSPKELMARTIDPSNCDNRGIHADGTIQVTRPLRPLDRPLGSPLGSGRSHAHVFAQSAPTHLGSALPRGQDQDFATSSSCDVVDGESAVDLANARNRDSSTRMSTSAPGSPTKRSRSPGAGQGTEPSRRNLWRSASHIGLTDLNKKCRTAAIRLPARAIPGGLRQTTLLDTLAGSSNVNAGLPRSKSARSGSSLAALSAASASQPASQEVPPTFMQGSRSVGVGSSASRTTRSRSLYGDFDSARLAYSQSAYPPESPENLAELRDMGHLSVPSTMDGYERNHHGADTSTSDTSSGNSTELMQQDMDTSAMSAAGHNSFASLQSLLNKMTNPRSGGLQSLAKRRRSSMLHGAAPENDAIQEEILGELAHPPAQQFGQNIPGQAIHFENGVEASRRLQESIAQPFDENTYQGMPSLRNGHRRRSAATLAARRISAGVPVPRRGSLLPVASSANAARAISSISENQVKDGLLVPGKAKAEGGAADGDQQPAMVKTEVVPEQTGEKAKPRAERSIVLKDVVAFVDVKTAEGDEAGGIFVDILRSLGARVRLPNTRRLTLTPESS